MSRELWCNNSNCKKFRIIDGDLKWIKNNGTYTRKCDRKVIKRYRCSSCHKSISTQTFSSTYRQRKPRINTLVKKLICSKVSLRQISREFGINRKTVKRRFLWLAENARRNQKKRLRRLKNIDFIQVDEMETHEHTKCKPLSIALAVVPGSRLILGAYSAEMPANGPLAAISRKKYGPRRDDRRRAFQNLLAEARPSLSEDVWVFSDKKPVYPGWIRQTLRHSSHYKAKGRRGCIVGYGELKKTGFDPLFWLNHTAAMIRDGLARMLRRTWCNTKLRSYLQNALDILVDYHNRKMEAAGLPVYDRNKWLSWCKQYGVLL